MTPLQKIRVLIIQKAIEFGEVDPMVSVNLNAENIDKVYEGLIDEAELYDAQQEVRCGGFDTDIETPYSRHYEAQSRAAQLPDGSWVGWTYWYGGGKHGCPEDIDWMEDAYDLSCVEEEKLVTVRTFTKTEA